jgi:hypothetical protein
MSRGFSLAIRSGVCRICGCTHERPCAVGCAWMDNGHTLCSVCHEIQSTILALFCPRTRAQIEAAVLAELDDLVGEGDVDERRIRRALRDLVAGGAVERPSRTTYDIKGGG